MAGSGTGWMFRGTVSRWIDADTADVECDLGFYITRKDRFRLLGSELGVNAFEMHAKDPALRELAHAGLARVLQLAPLGSPVIVFSQKAPVQEGFGRWLAQIITESGTNVGDVLLEEGLAVPYVRR